MLFQLNNQTFSVEDFRWVQVAAETLGNGTTAEDLVHAAAEGFMQIWRAREGVVITRITAARGGRTLEVVAIAGRGMARHATELFADLRRAAAVYDCRWVAGTILDHRFARRCEKELPLVGYRFVEEVGNGEGRRRPDC